ncbi:hypothetical protein MGG_17098 [Pyricularia oryzae 70-15]|uniref:HMG box domain-containing protein n=3 Tax=Pyricularia oryzae TaxID=318829 RepID=G4N8L9_PYRO7|nr:uncharacterized protein MGG_17098 [Pyricularia oryzae 70-15]EHA50213.1 hypothetical protein MGG_17098 [Pyricularia oryzae 70-15]ELQ35043.1 hypothetical protein OOU_Y34scaffold00726g2 [Pyricularia oryzae Y34]KAI7912233.1 hypothetical protein M9X92_010132 [Pyricularia oryzae]KAI7921771.1 hypothetical protein M0657_005963 [Pyricularia oryzae]
MRLEAAALLACSVLSFALTVPLKPRYIKPEHGVKMKRVILDAPMDGGGFVVVGTPAFLNYADANRERIKKASPGANDRQVEELIDKDWEKLSPEAKAEWKDKKPDGPGATAGGSGITPPKVSNITSSSGSAMRTPTFGAGRNNTITSASTSTSTRTSSSSQTPPTITPAPDLKPGGAGGPAGPTSTSTPFKNSTSSTSTSTSSSSTSTSSSSTSTQPGSTSTSTKTSPTQPPQNGPTGTPAKPEPKPGDPLKPEGDKNGVGTPSGNPGAGAGNGPAQMPPIDVNKIGLDGIPQGLPGSWKPELPQDLSPIKPAQPVPKSPGSLPGSKLPPSGPISKPNPDGLDNKLPPAGLDNKLPPAGLDSKLPPSGPDNKLPPPGPIDKPHPDGFDNKLPPASLNNKLPADIKVNPVRGGPLDPTAKPKPAPIGGLGDDNFMTNPPFGGPAAPKPKGPLPGPLDDGGSIILTPVIVVGPPHIDGPLGGPPRGIPGNPGGMMDDDDHDQMPFGHPGKPKGRGSSPSSHKGPHGRKRPGPVVIGEDIPVTLEDHDDAPLGRTQRGKPTRSGDREVVLEDGDLLDGPLPGPRGGRKNQGGPGLITVDIIDTTKHSNWRRGERAQRVRRREVSAVSDDRRHVRHQNMKREQQQQQQ